ncbi:MAG TPA: IucA/IucC family siderophore biosynthesis protein [Streptosporangiales bacterium]
MRAAQDPARLAGHLTPEFWQRANRALVAKAVAEYAHERLLVPERAGAGYVVHSDDGAVRYDFEARVGVLEHWRVDAASIVRTRAGERLPLDALAFVVEVRHSLGLADGVLPVYLEEIASTLASSAFRLSRPALGAAELAAADFQTVEAAMTEGHPCFVANSGRLGFGADEYLAYAPEAAEPVRLVWVAVRRDLSVFRTSAGVERDELLVAELGTATLTRFADTMNALGLDLGDYHLMPVHPWQWRNRIAVTLAADVGRRDVVCLGYGEDDYRAQQSIRTFFNITRPDRHYVKTALSVLNMGFLRGLSADYMEATPAVNDWVAGVVGSDEVLRATRFGILREVAAVGYRSEHYEAAAPKGSPYRKMLAALWRESPVGRLRTGERVVTMASLLHVDRDGDPFASALIARSGRPPAVWLRRYLDAYLVPLLHLLYAYGLAFMPHGENVVLVLEDDVPTRVFLKDIAEEVVAMDPDVRLPEAVSRIRADVPDEVWLLSVFTDVFDCFFRFLAAILDTSATLTQDVFWSTVAACVRDYQRSVPELAQRFERFDLFAERFPLSCLNRLQLRDNRQMVDLQDPAGSLVFAGTLANPIARYR